MKKIYLSSTVRDLSPHRKAVFDALRKIRYDVKRMEDYPARDRHTRAGCEEDVDASDIYVGIFAWRYGYIPPKNNHRGLSITELEYRRASDRKPCLIFLLRDKARWPSAMRDSKNGKGDRGKRIRALRSYLKQLLFGYFTTPDNLATEVLAAIHQHESTRRIERLKVLDEIKESVDLGTSYLGNIQEKIIAVRDTQIVEIRLGPTPWWTTRLHLVSALATDFTGIRQFVFLDEHGLFITMASPHDVRRALTRRQPQLERVYLDSRPVVPVGAVASAREVAHITKVYRQKVSKIFGRPEIKVAEEVSKILLTRDLGIEPSADGIERKNGQRAKEQAEILNRNTPFVALLDKGRLVSLVDRVQMASQIARLEFQERAE